MKPDESKLESDQFSDNSDSDSDICEEEEISRLFPETRQICNQNVTTAKNNYILHISATQNTNPNIAVGFSNNDCKVYSLTNANLVELSTISESSDVIIGVKFCVENDNFLYTGSSDSSIKLWDLRIPAKPCSQFIDTTMDRKIFTSFDVSSNNRLLAASTDLFEGDAFILFWDVRKSDFLGGYWESHTDDITQVKFHPNDFNKLLSGSTDGLINIYDLNQSCEDDALIDSLNTESSVEKLFSINISDEDVIACITHTCDVQFWNYDNAEPIMHFRRAEIAKSIKKKSENSAYIVDVLDDFLLAGSNCYNGCLRGLKLRGKILEPACSFKNNSQIVRCSWINKNTKLLLTGGESGFLNAWQLDFEN